MIKSIYAYYYNTSGITSLNSGRVFHGHIIKNFTLVLQSCNVCKLQDSHLLTMYTEIWEKSQILQ